MSNFLEEKALEYFYHLHQYPELSNEEYETTKFIISELDKIGGYELDTQTKTGVIATINPGCDFTIGLRGDIDALPVKEMSDLEYKSKVDGVMHACGHDAHTSVMLSLAHYIATLDLKYTIKLIFQHSEEVTPGGSAQFFANGSLDDVDHFFSFHVEPNFNTGQVLIKSGALYASIDDFFVNVIGKGGHVATPQYANDPLPCAAAMVSEISNAITKRIDPMNPPLIGIGTLNYGEGSPNTIGNEVYFCGTIRTHNTTTREKSIKYFNNVIESIAQSYDISAKIKWEHGEPVLVNDENLIAEIEPVLIDKMGSDVIVRLDEANYGGEDFSNYSSKKPSIYFLLGCKANDYDFHHEKFVVDTKCLPYAIDLFKNIVDYYNK